MFVYSTVNNTICAHLLLFSSFLWLTLRYSCRPTPIRRQNHVPQSRLQISLSIGKILHLNKQASQNKLKKKKSFRLFRLYQNLFTATFISLCWGVHLVQVAQCANCRASCRLSSGEAGARAEARGHDLLTLCMTKGTWGRPGDRTRRDSRSWGLNWKSKTFAHRLWGYKKPRGSFIWDPSSEAPAPAASVLLHCD